MLPESTFRDRGPLEGRFVRLVPLRVEHVPDLVRVAHDPAIFRYLRYDPTNSPEKMADLIRTFLAHQEAGSALPFAIQRRRDDVLLGMTRLFDIDRANAAVEVGGTWTAPELWGSVVNPESKRLLLGRAFETEGALRVQIKTDLRNLRSQRAIEKLGAIREGVRRDDLIMPDGWIRSSVVYSILQAEWPGVRDLLDARIRASADPMGWP